MSLDITKDLFCWSSWVRVPQVLYPCQVTYVLNSISSQTLSSSIQPDQNLESTDTPSSLAQFTSTCISQSNIHMVQNLRMLDATLITKVIMNSALSNKPFVTLTCSNKRYFKLKNYRNDHFLNCKARWVAPGFKQKEGINFLESFGNFCSYSETNDIQVPFPQWVWSADEKFGRWICWQPSCIDFWMRLYTLIDNQDEITNISKLSLLPLLLIRDFDSPFIDVVAIENFICYRGSK